MHRSTSTYFVPFCTVNDVSEFASENDARLDLLSQLTASDDGEMLDAGIVSLYLLRLDATRIER